MHLRKNRELKILSHSQIATLNHHYRLQFLTIYFDELRSFLLPIHHYAKYHLIFSNNSHLLSQIQNFWLSLSHCSLTLDSRENQQFYFIAEKNLLAIYRELYEFRKKFTITIIETLFRSLHLIIQQCYPTEEIPKIQFSLSPKILESIDKDFYPLKIMMQNPMHSVYIHENESCKKECKSLFFLYQKSDFSDKTLQSLRKDIFLTTEKYPLADHDKILDGFLNKTRRP